MTIKDGVEKVIKGSKIGKFYESDSKDFEAERNYQFSVLSTEIERLVMDGVEVDDMELAELRIEWSNEYSWDMTFGAFLNLPANKQKWLRFKNSPQKGEGGRG